MRYYAGIGARKAPEDILKKMSLIAFRLRQEGYILRSGGAVGSDSAFMSSAGVKSEIFKANDFSNNGHFTFPRWVEEEVVKHCWECPIENMRPFIAALIKRNMMQILGKNGDSPVDFVICWTPMDDPCDKGSGGTRYATRCAVHHGIPVFNLKNNDHKSIINEVIIGD